MLKIVLALDGVEIQLRPRYDSGLGRLLLEYYFTGRDWMVHLWQHIHLHFRQPVLYGYRLRERGCLPSLGRNSDPSLLGLRTNALPAWHNNICSGPLLPVPVVESRLDEAGVGSAAQKLGECAHSKHNGDLQSQEIRVTS
jgi:hypothetical protein